MLLEQELGDVLAAIELLTTVDDVSVKRVTARVRVKLEKLRLYIHHNHAEIDQALGASRMVITED